MEPIKIVTPNNGTRVCTNLRPVLERAAEVGAREVYVTRSRINGMPLITIEYHDGASAFATFADIRILRAFVTKRANRKNGVFKGAKIVDTYGAA